MRINKEPNRIIKQILSFPKFMQILLIVESNVYIHVSKCNVCIYAGLHVLLHNYFSFIPALQSIVSIFHKSLYIKRSLSIW